MVSSSTLLENGHETRSPQHRGTKGTQRSISPSRNQDVTISVLTVTEEATVDHPSRSTKSSANCKSFLRLILFLTLIHSTTSADLCPKVSVDYSDLEQDFTQLANRSTSLLTSFLSDFSDYRGDYQGYTVYALPANSKIEFTASRRQCAESEGRNLLGVSEFDLMYLQNSYARDDHLVFTVTRHKNRAYADGRISLSYTAFRPNYGYFKSNPSGDMFLSAAAFADMTSSSEESSSTSTSATPSTPSTPLVNDSSETDKLIILCGLKPKRSRTPKLENMKSKLYGLMAETIQKLESYLDDRNISYHLTQTKLTVDPAHKADQSCLQSPIELISLPTFKIERSYNNDNVFDLYKALQNATQAWQSFNSNIEYMSTNPEFRLRELYPDWLSFWENFQVRYKAEILIVVLFAALTANIGLCFCYVYLCFTCSRKYHRRVNQNLMNELTMQIRN